MTRLLLLTAGLSIGSTAAFGLPCTSPTFTNLQTLITAGSCTSGNSAFTVTFSGFGITGPSASAVDVSAAFGNISGSSGFTFSNQSAGSLAAFTGLTYTATIGNCGVGFTCFLNGVLEQSLFANRTGTGTVTISESAGATPITLTPANQTYGPSTFGNVTSITKSISNDGLGTLQSIESDVYGVSLSTTPEPATLSLMGAALLGVGLLRKKYLVRS